MSNVKTVIAFAAGAAVGTAATWFYAKNKYEQIAQEEINNVKEFFSKKYIDCDTEKASEEEDISEDDEEDDRKDDILSYSKILSNEGYVDYSTLEVKSDKTIDEIEAPYVISPDEFGEYDDYERISLTYYADLVLTDDMDEMVEDVEATIGFDSLNHFGEYEDDSVFVRNDRRKADYEILLDTRRFEDVRAGRQYTR